MFEITKKEKQALYQYTMGNADMGEILGISYEKVDEAEVLIAPFTQIVEVYSLPSLEIQKY